MTERTHHQHPRRPPDVEEALSSMLWTPYEHPSTDSSSEDDAEQLNKRLRTTRSHSDDVIAASAAAYLPMPTSSYFGCDDLLLPTTHFVPFSNITFSTNNNNVAAAGAITTPYHHQQQQQRDKSRNAANNKYRFSYPHYGPTLSLRTKSWWSSTSATALAPPSYESLYSRNSSAMRLAGASIAFKADLRSANAPTVTTICTPKDTNARISFSKRIESGAAKETVGRLVHSFTDNFIDERCKELSESMDNSNNNNIAQSLRPSNMSTDQLTSFNSVAKLSKQQAEERKGNDVTMSCKPEFAIGGNDDCSMQRKHKWLANDKHKQNREESSKGNSDKNICKDHYDDHEGTQKVANMKLQKLQMQPTPDYIDDSNMLATTNVQQVNHPASVAELAFAATPTASAFDTHSATSSPTLQTTTRTQQMNSPTTTSYKSGTTTSRINNKSSVAPHAVEQRPAATISPSREFDEFASSLPFPSPSLRQFALRVSSSTRRKVVIPVTVGIVKSSKAPDRQPLTTNKCLGELERLRAAIRASESQPRRHPMLLEDKMRLNIPSATAAGASQPTASATTTNTVQFVPTTSSVFLTTANNVNTNNNTCSNSVNNYNPMNYSNLINSNNNINNNNCSVAILSKPTATSTNRCQRQPSLTIQVNSNNNNNNVIGSAGVLKESFVNNNGISVVNCNYFQSENGNNRNSVIGVSVNCSSSVPNDMFSSSSNISSNESISSRSASAPKSNNKEINNEVIVDPKAIATTSIAANGESVNVISVNSETECPERLSVTATPSPPAPTSIASNSVPTASPTRTFTSTECQTDDIETLGQLRTPVHRYSFQQPALGATSPQGLSSAHTSREQRRRERRERRNQQHQLQHLQQLQHVVAQLPPAHLHPHAASRRHSDRHSLPAPPLPPTNVPPHLHPPLIHHASVPPNATMPLGMAALLRPMLPDILHSHFPPPYSALSVAADNISNVNSSALPTRPPPPPPPPPSGTAATALGPGTMLTPVISTVPLQGATTIVSDGRFSIPLPIIRRSPSERSGKGCCGQWFAGPPLRALIAVVALGGVACALGGAALGATGLAGPPSSHFTAALLMIGVGVVLVTVSGAAWRMTAPGGPPCLGLGSSVDLGRCGRRPCSRGGGAPHGLLYPEFQHRPPPPSYQASMQEYRLRLLLLDRDRQNGVVRGNSPPPTYRSHSGSLLRAPLTTTMRSAGGSVGGSEYSLPPSYRSRNATPATICSERSIETAPSGRLLANEDIPEPLSPELLPQYNSLVHLHRRLTDSATQSASLHQAKTSTLASSTTTATPTTDSTYSVVGHQLRTSAIVEVESASPKESAPVAKDKISLVCHNEMRTSASGNASTKGKDLVTIVRISQNHSSDQPSANEVDNKTEQQQQEEQQQTSTDQMQILAHL